MVGVFDGGWVRHNDQNASIGEEEKVNAMFDVGLKAEIAHADNDMPKPYVLRYGIIAK